MVVKLRGTVVTDIYRFFNIQQLKNFLLKGKQGMDPITSIFNFLSTPEGQKLLAPLTAAEADFAKILASLIASVAKKAGL